MKNNTNLRSLTRSIEVTGTAATFFPVGITKYIFKETLSGHANAHRPSYTNGKKGGLLLCSWPKDGKIFLPIVYSDEMCTGIKYQVLLI